MSLNRFQIKLTKVIYAFEIIYVMSQVLTKFGLSDAVATTLVPIISAIGESITASGQCQYDKAQEVLQNAQRNKQLYKYLPAIIYPDRVRRAYLDTYNVVANPTYGDLDKARRIQSIIIRHGLIVSTEKDGKIVYMYIGGIPDGFSMTNNLMVSQGGAKFSVKKYKSILSNPNINPQFGILPLADTGNYSTNPSISQGGNGYVADIVGIFNYMASTLSAIKIGTYYSPAFITTASYNFSLNGVLYSKLNASTSPVEFADTPSIHITLTNNLIAPSIPDSTNFNPILSDLFGNLNYQEFNNAVKGSPIYISSGIFGMCDELQLRGFVSYLSPLTGDFITYIPGINQDVMLSPGLAFGGVIQPPLSWSYNDLVSWAINNGMGLSWNDFDKWVDLTLFESKVIQQLISRGYGYLVDTVTEHFDPSPEVIEKGVDNVVNGIVNAVSSGINSVANFLRSL